MGEAPLILVVEDDASIRRVVSEALLDEGYRVVAVADAESAFTHLEAQHTRLIVLDKRLPAMDGYAFAERYSESAEERAPIILLTASAEPVELPAGVATYLRKPFDLDDLLESVERCLRKSSGDF